MRKGLAILLAAGLGLMMTAGVAFANPHLGSTGDRTYVGGANDIDFDNDPQDCIKCHENSDQGSTGPHGGYTATTDKCGTCHDVHMAETWDFPNMTQPDMNAQLLPGQTVTDVCNFCHDLTGTVDGPYNLIAAGGQANVKAAHKVADMTFGTFTDSEGHASTVGYEDKGIPGGDAVDGYSYSILQNGSQGELSNTEFTCDSCHTPHGVNTVARYLGESEVKHQTVPGIGEVYFLTNRLLKNRPNATSTDPKVEEYGSQWCLNCHKGRDELTGGSHNHPVNESKKGYYFLEEKLGVSEATVKDVVYDFTYLKVDATNYGNAGYALTDGYIPGDVRSNKQYALSTYDYTTGQGFADGHKEYSDYAFHGLDNNGPSCQQCHGSAREVENSFASQIDTMDRSFPHISSNRALLVERVDDFCTNCHEPSTLP